MLRGHGHCLEISAKEGSSIATMTISGGGGRDPRMRNRRSNPFSSRRKRKGRLVTISTTTKAPAQMRPAFRKGQILSFIGFSHHFMHQCLPVDSLASPHAFIKVRYYNA